jgi:hypothetical protein
MKILTDEQRRQLLENGQRQHRAEVRCNPIDFEPVVKLFTPDAGAVWFLTGLLPSDPDIAFGLCNAGLGYPELGYVRVSELEALRGSWGPLVERDLRFKATKPLSADAEEAYAHGRIIT